MPRKTILYQTNFRKHDAGWNFANEEKGLLEFNSQGLLIHGGRREKTCLPGPGIHTYNGNSIEVHFSLPDGGSKGELELCFISFEWTGIKLNFAKRQAIVTSSDWTAPQPHAKVKFKLKKQKTHILKLLKEEAPGGVLKNANLTAYLDGELLASVKDVNILPEMGAHVAAKGTSVQLKRFVQRGVSNGIPEYLHVAGWQMLNVSSIEENLASIFRGLRLAAEKGVKLLVTTETSLTGLFPINKVTKNPKPIAAAEKKLRKFIRNLPDAPHIVVGLPVWVEEKHHKRKKTRYNTSRVYDPDGNIIATCPKIHSCEHEFWHGHRLNEFDICGVPCSMHICHDGRYPYTWTLPVMFGARLLLHPANAVQKMTGSIEGFERAAKSAVGTSHAFRIHVNGGGCSYIVGPTGELLAVSKESSRENSNFPNIGEPVECLLDANIRIHDAQGQWPLRAFRASEQASQAYIALYKALGGKRI